MSQVKEVFDPKLGPRMRERREHLELTLAEVAARCGVQPSAIMRYEKRTRYPAGRIFPLLAEALEVPIEWFFDESVDPDGYDSSLVRGVPYVDLVILKGKEPVETIFEQPEVLHVPKDWISKDRKGFVVKVTSSPDRSLVPDNCDVVVESFHNEESPGLGDVVLISAMETPCFARVKLGLRLSLGGEDVSLDDVLLLGKVVRIATAP